ncbi:HAMP domain-containing methyl-accepting chemotaxis protein [Paenibacillus sp. GD4]|uniref:methyl-accepting chemotaxis protein n=1 Tax=Paenibacillus sp. GD4 TaxID=3068890 RepID=UPI0027966BDB|nr:HAMP domain-containing methyl-accepting chemotaxis protein [Paenibacillus sp. GD4]MDQ1910215.1 HAMP domain-containing methyl-accepting chemotaxis protein [Paenibacillus sp. GD4]
MKSKKVPQGSIDRFGAIFTPGEALMNRLKYVHKFIVIGLIVTVPMLLLAILQYSDASKEAAHIKNELVGVSYAEQLNDFLYAIDTRRALVSGIVLGDASLKEELTKAEAAIDIAFSSVERTNEELGEDLQTNDRWNRIKQKWQELKDKGTELASQESLDQHSAIMTDIRSLLTHITNTSGLVLDNELGSYYLMDSAMKQMPLLMDRVGRTRALTMAYAGMKTPSTADKRTLTTLLDQIKTTSDTIKTNNEITAQLYSREGEKLQEAFSANDSEIAKLMEFIDARVTLTSTVSISPKEAYTSLHAAVEQTYKHYESQLKLLRDLLELRVNLANAQMVTLVVVTVLVLLAVIYLFISFYLSVLKAVSALETSAARIAQGDLSTHVELRSKDELAIVGASFNLMADTFRATIVTGQQVSEQVAEAAELLTRNAHASAEVSNQISGAIQEVAAGAHAQLKGAEETSTAMEEMAIGVQRIAETSTTVAEAAAAAEQQALHGNNALQQAIGQMNNIHVTVGDSAAVVQQLGARSEEIGSIISVISEIAVHTNLLALNASIEAARAGEHGAGFMVVASEVKKLAEQTKSSARQITELIREIQEQTGGAIAKMSSGVKEVELGKRVIEQAGTMLGHIVSSVQQVSEQIQEVSAAAEQMSAGTEQVTASMGEMVGISRTSADNAQHVSSSAGQQLASMQEIAASADELNKVSHKLRMVINQYKM